MYCNDTIYIDPFSRQQGHFFSICKHILVGIIELKKLHIYIIFATYGWGILWIAVEIIKNFIGWPLCF